jgi:uncharacterized Zn finger protein (UPF0148 family)
MTALQHLISDECPQCHLALFRGPTSIAADTVFCCECGRAGIYEEVIKKSETSYPWRAQQVPNRRFAAPVWRPSRIGRRPPTADCQDQYTDNPHTVPARQQSRLAVQTAYPKAAPAK